jgi:hypothetical protein
MTTQERMQRVHDAVLIEEMSGVTEWWFLYFTDPDQPKGKRFLGACIVEGKGMISAVQRAHRLGINPGGQVLAYDTPAHEPSFRDRLITDDAEMATLGYARKAVRA